MSEARSMHQIVTKYKWKAVLEIAAKQSRKSRRGLGLIERAEEEKLRLMN